MDIKENLFIKFLRKIKYHWHPKKGSIENVLEKLNQGESVFFIEIGANQTDRNDHVAKYLNNNHWNGILVEPQKKAFLNLTEKYSNNTRIKLVNAAISENFEKRNLYRFKFSDETWVTSLSSFSREQLIKHYEHGWLKSKATENGLRLSENVDELIDYEAVDCITIDYLIRNYKVKNVDLLIIDTEGYDYEILKMFDFKTFKPKILIFEHRHLSQNDFRSALKLLKRENYQLLVEGGDTLGHLASRQQY